jgi:type VI secretion system protein ImpK
VSDPFGGDSDRTMIKPMGGGRSPDTPQPPPAGSPLGQRPGPVEQITITGSSENPLLQSAAPLFALVNQLRGSVSHSDPLGLQTHVGQEIMNFEAKARQLGETPERILAARYTICTLLDETALSTPWGVESQWSNQTLLVRFHNEARGGEKFFQILERLYQDPAGNLNLLEFMYVCLSLGFMGKYRLQPRGKAELEQIQHSVFELIRTFRGQAEAELSVRWRGVEDPRTRLAQYVPLWVLGAVGAGICLLVYVGFLFSLNSQSDPVAGTIVQLAKDTIPLETREATPIVQAQTLRDVLTAMPQVETAIRDGLVQVEEGPTSSKVRMWNLFPSGQGVVAPESTSLIFQIAGGLSGFQGGIQVVGHTDDQAIRSLRFPSNMVLSQRRSESVAGLLRGQLPTRRLSAEGRSDTEPLVANDNAVNRALNRRVEITLYYEAAEL